MNSLLRKASTMAVHIYLGVAVEFQVFFGSLGTKLLPIFCLLSRHIVFLKRNYSWM